MSDETPFAPIVNVPYPYGLPSLALIQPFTYREGATFQEILEKLSHYISVKLIPAINADLGAAGTVFENAVNQVIAEVNTALDAAQGTVTADLAEMDQKVADGTAALNAIVASVNNAVTAAQTAAAAAAGSATASAGSATAAFDSAGDATTAQAAAEAAQTAAEAAVTNLLASRLEPGTYPVEIPAALEWPAAFPVNPSITVYADGGVFGSAGTTPEGMFDAFSWARQSPGVTYYVSGTGVDTNAGTSEAAPVRSIRKAIQLANASGSTTGAKIYIDATHPEAYCLGFGQYDATGQGTQPAIDIAFISRNGRAQIGPWLPLGTPAKSGSFPNTYSVAYATGTLPPIRVIDTQNVDANDVPRDLTLAASASDCNATPGSWYYDGANVYIHRLDGSPVRPWNTKVLMHIVNMFSQNAVNVYYEGIDFYGGRGGQGVGASMSAQPSSGNNVYVANDCSSTAPGGLTGPTANDVSNAFGFNNYRGLVYLYACVGMSAMADNLNLHVGAAAYSYFLTVNCRGLSAGANPAGTSCNGHTIHETARAIDIAGEYIGSRGGTVHNIASTLSLYAGTFSSGDLGGTDSGGGVLEPSSFMTHDSAEIYLYKTRESNTEYAYYAGGTGKIHTRENPYTPLQSFGAVDTW